MIFSEWPPLVQALVWAGGCSFLLVAALSVIQVVGDGIRALRGGRR